jgi:hypothetical protein
MAQLVRDYAALLGNAHDRDRQGVIEYLDSTLPERWQEDYSRMTEDPGELLIVSFGDANLIGPFCRYLFDHASSPSHCSSSSCDADKSQEDRVVAVWGTSRSEPSHTRDRSRVGGLLRGVWDRRFAGDDRGHFFAHTMGGGLDINIFPQARRLNRGSPWRRMERYCATNPGTFSFVRPIYGNESWRPVALEYGIFKTAEDKITFWGNVFANPLP